MYIGGDVIVKTLLVFTFAFTFIGNADSRGFRGGGGRFRSTRFRNTRSRVGTSPRRIGTNRFPRGWKVAAAGGMIFGFSSYQHRRSYRRNPSREPQICTNLYDYARTNGSNYQYFICPLADQPDSYKYCCGETNRQHCCTYWSNPWNIVGIVIGILILIGAICACAYCCFGRKGSNNMTYAGRIMSRRQEKQANRTNSQQMSYQSPAPPYTEPQMGYPQQTSYQSPQPGYPAQPGGYPPPQPGDYQAPGYQPVQQDYQSGPTGYQPPSQDYQPAGNVPYPPAPGAAPYPAWQQPPPPPEGSAGYPAYPTGQPSQPPYPTTAPPPYPS